MSYGYFLEVYKRYEQYVSIQESDSKMAQTSDSFTIKNSTHIQEYSETHQ